MNKKTKIAFVSYGLDVGGIETLILDICKRLDKDKYSACVFTFQKDGKLQKEFERIDVPVYLERKAEGIDWMMPIKLAKRYKQLSIDIVHVHNQSTWLHGGIAAKLAGISLVYSEHTTPDCTSQHTKRWEKIEWVLSKITNQITTVSNSIAKFMVDDAGISTKKIKVIYNGIETKNYDIEVDTKAKRRELGIMETDLVVGNVASLLPKKDPKTLLKAFKLVLEEVPSAKLLMAGDGQLKNELLQLKDELQLDGSVKFLGNRRDIPELLKIFDVFALSSIKEGFPIAILEAMASGLPVVATDVDGNAESVIHGKTGIIVPSRNPEALAAAICKLLANKENATFIGEMGRRRVRKYFTFEKMMQGYEDIFDSIRARPQLRKKIKSYFKKVICRLLPKNILFLKGESKGRSVALTFDDGPHPEYTLKILDTLRSSNVKATFFLTGSEAEKYPHLVKAIANDGHEIGNHNLFHQRIGRKNYKEFTQEIERAGKVIEDIIGHFPKLFRPPYGEINWKLLWFVFLKRVTIVLWSLDSNDFCVKSSDQVRRRLKRARPGDVIVLHDDYAHTAEALSCVIGDLKEKELGFASISKLMRIK